MSLNSKPKLRAVAIALCRELRKNSTTAEKIFWEAVRNRKFMGKKINRQFPIYFDLLGKETFFIADFYCHEEKLVIEIDGGYHKRQKEYDALRTEVINTLGIRVVRFKNELIENNLNKALELLNKEFKSHLLFPDRKHWDKFREGTGG